MTIASGNTILASDLLTEHNSDGTHGAITVSKSAALSGVISPSSIGADQNDYSPTNLSISSTLRLTASAAYNITGLAGGAAGRVIIIHNVGSYTITLKDESASSTAANRFALSVDVVLGTDQSCILQYDVTSNRWRSFTTTSKIIQVVYTETGAVSTTTTTIPLDDTIPQITEGGEFMTKAIIPTSATNILKIDVVCYMAQSNAAQLLIAALFQDSTANALAAGLAGEPSANYEMPVVFTHYMVAGTTSSTTFRVRGGGQTGATTTFNGSGGNRRFGGVLASSITITEIAA